MQRNQTLSPVDLGQKVPDRPRWVAPRVTIVSMAGITRAGTTVPAESLSTPEPS